MPTGTSAGLEDSTETDRLPDGVSASPTTKGSAAVAVSSETVWSARAETTGASFWPSTSMMIETMAGAEERTPSRAMKMKESVPVALASGV